MRFLLGLVATLAILWSAYWALAARGLEGELSAWFDTRRAEGWVAEYDTLHVAGFPYRFDTRVAGLSLADPDTGLAWTAPEFSFTALAYRPHHVIAVWPETQQIATPLEKIALGARTMEGSLVFRPGPALAVARANYVLEGVSLASSAGWRGALGRAALASEAVEGRENAYRLGFDAAEMRPPARLVAWLDKAGVLPDLFERMKVDATVAFDAPWDRRAVEHRRPQLTRIELALMDAQWGELALQAAGDLDVDEAGRPKGALSLRATNWREMVEIARASGRLPPGLADRVEDALGLIAGIGGRPETLDVELRFLRGQMFLGPVPLGPAPDLTIR